MAQFKTLKEVATDALERAQARLRDPRWGCWEYDAETMTLLAKEHEYGIPLMEVTDSAELVSWILQVRGKEWAAPQALSDLLEALDFILRPQANYCSGGMNSGFDVKTHLERFNLRVAQNQP